MAAAEFALQQQVEILYTDHHGWLRGLLRRKLGNAFDAADLAHDVYLQLLRTGRVPPADERRRHLTQIANGLVIDLYRRRRVEAAYLEALALLPEQ
ncbi:sigma factor, partial [Delftia sp. 67-8]